MTTEVTYQPLNIGDIILVPQKRWRGLALELMVIERFIKQGASTNANIEWLPPTEPPARPIDVDFVAWRIEFYNDGEKQVWSTHQHTVRGTDVHKLDPRELHLMRIPTEVVRQIGLLADDIRNKKKITNRKGNV